MQNGRQLQQHKNAVVLPEDTAKKMQKILQMRKLATQGRDPSTHNDTFQFILQLLEKERPSRILELGTAYGLTSCAMLLTCPQAVLTTIELDKERYLAAKNNYKAFGVLERATCIYGDAVEVLPHLTPYFDFIFLDSAKSQYLNYLPYLKQLLKPKGILLADDILLFGWVDGSVQVPQKRRSLVEKIQAYLHALEKDRELDT